ncbi:MAG: ribosomal protein S5 domain 2-type protein [Monoraphidium minutum]|nr:MAG: ribosomal protein S5 domain 2-type protein [Monoraphidium minutum]
MQSEVSDAEKAYIAQGVAQDLRNDGRGCRDLRPVELALDVIAAANGSARLRAGATDVIAGVKVSLASPEPGAPDKGQVLVSVECSSCASPEFKGRGGEDWGIDMAAALQSSLRAAMDLGALCVLSGKTAWRLHVDCLVLNDGGGLLSALSAAARAALAVTRLPKVEVTMGEGSDDEPEIELGDDSEGALLDVSALPVIITVGQIGSRCVADLTAEEEPCAAARLHVAVGPGGRVCGSSKAGGGGVPHATLLEMLEVAQQLGPRLIRELDAFLATAAATASAGA